MTDLQSRIAALSPEQRDRLERGLAGLAAARGHVPEARIPARDRSRPVPLAFQQEREWAIAQFRPANNIPGAFRVEGSLDVELMGRVLTQIVGRHEVLRSTVELQDDGTRVQVLHPVTPVPTPITDLAHLDRAQQRAEVLRRWNEEVVRPFDPVQPQRLRTALLRMGPDEHVVLITTDHAAADLVSVAILVQEFATLYVGHQTGALRELPPLEVQYGDFAAWQRDVGEKRMAAEVEYWRQTLDGIPGPLALPSDRPFPIRPTFAGDAHFVDLPPEFAAALRGYCEREQVSLGVVLLAGVSALLHRYLGRDDLVIGEIVSGRNRVEVERLIGCFVTALPLRMQVDGATTLREVVQQARRTVLTAYDHQDLPIARLIDELDLGHEASQTSMTHMWIDVRTPERTLEVPGLRISQEPIEISVSAAPLTLDANQSADGLQLQWVYMTEMFDTATVELLAEQFDRVLHRLVTDPDARIDDVELAVGQADRPQPRGAVDGPGVVEQFRRRAALAPQAPAVVCDGVATSYRELDRAANRLAHRLRALGVGPDSRVGILVGRSPRLAEAILGVLGAGAAFVPLDPGYPAERLGFLLADSDADVLVTEQAVLGDLTAAGLCAPQTIVLDDPLADVPDGAPDGLPAPADPAYVIYTSGSTGLPKGVVVEHRSLATYARDVVDRLELGDGDRFLQFASPSFDVLVEELFPAWLTGGAVVVPTGHLISGEDDLVDLVDRERVTVMELPTAYWHEWVRELDRLDRVLPDHLRLVIIGGERVLPERLERWRRFDMALQHVYGLTETTVSSTFFRVAPGAPAAGPNLPIGTPLPSAELHVLDRRLRPVPVGGSGELYIGGPGVARGYHGRPALTAQRFVADPSRPGARLYRTGDLVRTRPDGALEFLGRVDNQVKIRGFRVEPAEIEAVLARHPDLADAVVGVHEPTLGHKRLVAWFVPQAGAAPVVADLRAAVERELPRHMVPSTFVELDALPLTANGKGVDRARLPEPDGQRLAVDADLVAPQTPVQQKLADVVAAVVGTGAVGVHDNFFEIGGDSILAIQVVARAQQEGIRLSPYDLFAHPTIASLAEVVTAGPTIDAEQGDVSGPVPLAPTQRWFAAEGVADPAHSNRSVLVELREAVEPRVAAEAVEKLLLHHDGLRQRLLIAGARTRVRVAPRGDTTPFEVLDLTGIDGAEQERRIAELGERLQAGLEPAVGPLVRTALVRRGGTGPDLLALVAHRLVADEGSLRILVEDLAAAIAGTRLPAKTTSWQSWVRKLVAHARTPEVQEQRDYWEALVARPDGALPSDGAGGSAPARTVSVTLPAAETDAAEAAAQRLSCDLEELLLTALGRTLAGWDGRPRHLVALERHDRDPIFDDVDLDRTVGWVSRTHPVALDCAPDGPPEAALRAVKDALRTVPANGTGWELLRQGADPVPEPRIDLLFGGITRPLPARGPIAAARAGFGPDEPASRRERYAIEVRTVRGPDGLTVTWRFPGDVLRPSTVEDLAHRHLAEVAAIADPDRVATGSVFTPTDFPLARVDQDQLDDLLSRL